MNRFIFNYSTGFQYRNSLTSLNLLHEKFLQPFKNVLSLSNESSYIQLFNWISIMCRNSFVLLNLLAQNNLLHQASSQPFVNRYNNFQMNLLILNSSTESISGFIWIAESTVNEPLWNIVCDNLNAKKPD